VVEDVLYDGVQRRDVEYGNERPLDLSRVSVYSSEARVDMQDGIAGRSYAYSEISFDSQTLEAVHMRNQIFSAIYTMKSKPIQMIDDQFLTIMRVYKYVAKDIAIHLNARRNSVDENRSKCRHVQLVNRMRNAKLNNRGKLLQGVVLHLRNKQRSKRNKTGLTLVELKNLKASMLVARAHFVGLKVLNQLISGIAISYKSILQMTLNWAIALPQAAEARMALLNALDHIMRSLLFRQTRLATFTTISQSMSSYSGTMQYLHGMQKNIMGKPILTMKQYAIFHTMLLRRNQIMLKNRTELLAKLALRLKKCLIKGHSWELSDLARTLSILLM